MSQMSYNGVNLPYVRVIQFQQKAILDDVAQTDWIYTQFNIQVQAVINTNYLNSIYPVITGTTTNPADVMNAIRSVLLRERMALSFKTNGVDLIPQATAGPGTVDAKNGPIPQSCDITQLTNVTFLVTYHIIAHYWENNTLTGSSPSVVNNISNDVLFNRWSESVDIDNCNFTTRTREGKFAIRSDNADGFIADQLRSQFAVVGVPPGFTRRSSAYTVTPDGLAIHYRIVDKEEYKMPPYPAFEAKGEYVETATLRKPMRRAECRIHLKGSKDTDQVVLLQTAVFACSSKLSTNRTGNNQPQINLLESAEVRVDLYENNVECRMSSLMKPLSTPGGKGTTDGIWGFDFKGICTTPGSEPGQTVTPAYLDYGSAKYLLRAAAYYDPSLQATLNKSTGQMTQGLAVGQAGVIKEVPGVSVTTSDPGVNPQSTSVQTDVPEAQISTGTFPIDDPAGAAYDDDDLSDPKSIFADYQITNHYEADGHTYMLGLSSTIPFKGDSVAFCQLCSSTLLWVSDWTAAKFSRKPDIPDPDLGDPNWVPLDIHTEPAMLTLMPDGKTTLYRISGTYVYGARNPRLASMFYARPPWLENFFERFVAVEDFEKHLINL